MPCHRRCSVRCHHGTTTASTEVARYGICVVFQTHVRRDANVSGNTLTIVSTVAGIAFGVVTSWWFTRSSKRDSDAKQESLASRISTLQGVLSEVADSVAKKPITPRNGSELQPVLVAGHDANVVKASPQPATSASALDVVVRASLGALLDEHGDVSVPRLLRAVTQRLPDVSPSLISSSLERLRSAGKLSWPGDDVMKAGVITIHPQ